MSRHFLVTHRMFDDVFDVVPPFFGLFRLIQRFVIESLDQIVGCTFTASAVLELVSFGVVVAIEGEAIVSPATIRKRNNSCASFMIITLMHVDDGCRVKWLLSVVFSSYLKRSRAADPGKWWQQVGKRSKFRESSAKGEDRRFVTGATENFRSSPRRL